MLTQRAFGFALALLAFAAVAAEAQLIQGVVIDDLSRTAVAGAEVLLLTPRASERVQTTTSDVGAFLIRAPRSGVYRLRVTHPGYATYEADSVVVGSSEAIMLEIRLGLAAVPLEPMVVTARRNAGMPGFDDRREAGFGRFITREDIDRRSAFRTSDLLRTIQGITLRRSGRADGMIVLMRGGGIGMCEPAVWVDGVLVRQLPGNTIDDFLTPGIIEAAEVYPSYAAAPAEYAVGMCGVIVFWTRRGSGEDGRPWQWKKVLAGASAALLIIWLIGG
ncbi:MAG TPA: TonB-dependent receptor [Longimicrobiales bacterium]|nr:TonB-dependent receptor [Longimicrobiales bacterium]